MKCKEHNSCRWLNLNLLYIFNYTGPSWVFPMDIVDNGILIGSVNGTLVGDTGLKTGRYGLALYIDGVDQYVNFGYQGDTCLGYFMLCSSGWASAFWVQPNGGNGIIMDTGLFANRGMRIATYSNSTYIIVRFQSENKMWKIGTKINPAQGWIHVVITWRFSHGSKLYIDGGLL